MRRLRTWAVVAALALVAAACSNASSLAEVDGIAITDDDLVDFRPGNSDPALSDSDVLRQDLGNIVVLRILENAAAEDFDVEVTEGDLAAFYESPPEGLEGAAAQLTAQVDSEEVTQAFADATVRSFLLREEIIDALVLAETPGLVELFETSPEQFTTGCIRHVVVETQEEAIAARARVGEGETMAEVAREVSQDPTPGGLLINQQTTDCAINFATLSTTAPAFMEMALVTPLNELSDVFQTDFGWHFLRVEARDAPADAAAVAADPLAYAPDGFADQLFDTWFFTALADAEVDVDPAIGEWNSDQGGIVPIGS
jgi:parvulin-like peptidyl-prolyl isomerase